MYVNIKRLNENLVYNIMWNNKNKSKIPQKHIKLHLTLLQYTLDKKIDRRKAVII